ncbi:MAG: biotin--[acetyl-CoA-carboxylase] ligase [Bacillota bacterium]
MNQNWQQIKRRLNNYLLEYRVKYIASLNSTNEYIKANYKNEPEGLVIVAGEQTRGRGRKGNDWHSPPGGGLYFSILLKPEIFIEYSSYLTVISALALYNILIDDYPVFIKWPNDIYLHNKKIAGILVESNCYHDKIKRAILGVGCNTNINEFPSILEEKATSLRIFKGDLINNQDVVVDYLNEFELLYAELLNGNRDFMSKWEEILDIKNQQIKVQSGENIWQGTVQEITQKGHLLIKMNNGNIKEVSSGEVTVLKGGYQS